MTDNSRKVFDYLKENSAGADLTAKDVAEACGVSIQAVTGSVNGLVKKGLAFREEATIEDGEKEKTVKYIRLTEEGYAFDPDAEVEKEKK